LTASKNQTFHVRSTKTLHGKACGRDRRRPIKPDAVAKRKEGSLFRKGSPDGNGCGTRLV